MSQSVSRFARIKKRDRGKKGLNQATTVLSALSATQNIKSYQGSSLFFDGARNARKNAAGDALLSRDEETGRVPTITHTPQRALYVKIPRFFGTENITSYDWLTPTESAK